MNEWINTHWFLTFILAAMVILTIHMAFTNMYEVINNSLQVKNNKLKILAAKIKKEGGE